LGIFYCRRRALQLQQKVLALFHAGGGASRVFYAEIDKCDWRLAFAPLSS
jgi:hypothetical protein